MIWYIILGIAVVVYAISIGTIIYAIKTAKEEPINKDTYEL